MHLKIKSKTFSFDIFNGKTYLFKIALTFLSICHMQCLLFKGPWYRQKYIYWWYFLGLTVQRESPRETVTTSKENVWPLASKYPKTILVICALNYFYCNIKCEENFKVLYNKFKRFLLSFHSSYIVTCWSL